MAVISDGRRGRDGKMIDITPVGAKHFWAKGATVLNNSFTSLETCLGFKQRLVKFHVHEDRLCIARNPNPIVSDVECIVAPSYRSHGNIHPLGRSVGGIIDAM